MSFGAQDRTFEHVNDAMCSFFGMTREQLLACSWQELTHPDDIAEDLRLDGMLRRGEIDHYHLRKRYVLRDGTCKWGDLTVAAARHDGDLISVVQIVDVTAEEVARKQLQRMAETDSVTGLRSRSWLTDEIQRALTEASLSSSRVGVMFIDLTEFLVVNRTLGYDVGDEALCSLAEGVLALAPDGVHVGRFDGHHLVVVFPRVPDPAELERVAAELLAEVSRERVLRGHRISRTGSIGIAVSKRHSTATSLLREADQALTEAKAKGRSRAHLLGSASGGTDALQYLQLEHGLRVALDERQFVVHYQPQVRLDAGAISGFEALVCWNHPERGLLQPVAFMDTMEASGLVVPLGQQVLDEVCAMIRRTPDLPGPISVNVSAVEFAEEGWLESFAETVRRHGIRPEHLVVELTETTVLRLTDDARRALTGVRDMGIGIHIDDFGTGFASVGVLQQVPVTALKLDASFTAGLGADGSNLDLVRGIAGLAAGLGLDTIAEGIENAHQAELLRAAGWQHGQGFLFGRPQPQPLLSFARL